METVRFPRPMLLTRTLLNQALTERNKALPIGSKNPRVLPDRWIRNSSNGGPRSSLGTWDVQIVVRLYDKDESRAEDDAVLIHGLLLDAAGVGVTLPVGPANFPWVVRTRHVSGPINLSDPDLPELESYQSVVIWTLHYIP